MELNSLRGVQTLDILKLNYGLFLNEEQIFDEFNFPCLYNSQNLTEHLPQKVKKKQKQKPKKTKIMLQNEIREVVKNLEGVGIQEVRKKVYLGIQLLKIPPVPTKKK